MQPGLESSQLESLEDKPVFDLSLKSTRKKEVFNKMKWGVAMIYKETHNHLLIKAEQSESENIINELSNFGSTWFNTVT